VSHDRAFLDNVVTQVIAFDGDGRWIENPGGYQEWARVVRARREKPGAGKPAETSKRADLPRAARGTKLNYKETQELQALPARIEALEREQAELSRRLADTELYRSDPEQATTANLRYAEIDGLMLQLLARWEELEGRQGPASSPSS
jgi:ATP-binding cassette subfamily F protein uup